MSILDKITSAFAPKNEGDMLPPVPDEPAAPVPDAPAEPEAPEINPQPDIITPEGEEAGGEEKAGEGEINL